MKLLRVHIIKADTCGGLLDGLDLWFRSPTMTEYSSFDPLCLIGPNGAGKSQFLQVITEIFQAIYFACIPGEERKDGNPGLQFEIEYLIRPIDEEEPVHVVISRQSINQRRAQISIFKKKDGDWEECSLTSEATHKLLPHKVIGYTSGENETLSFPYLVSRAEYANDVRTAAINTSTQEKVLDTRLMLIDYGTNLEVVVSNLVTNNEHRLDALLNEVGLKDIYSFRCVIQLIRRSGTKSQASRKEKSGRKDIQLTDELEKCIEDLKSCATTYSYNEKDEKYIFDYWVNEQTKAAFSFFWDNTFSLYSSLHKLAMLNDLAIPKYARERFQKDTKKRRFATRLPEPQDEEKVFRFDQVQFASKSDEKIVDYVALSDGEHQLVQVLGIFSMLSFSNVLFVLDEPESHLNPQWRVKFISRLLDLPTKDGVRGGEKRSLAAEQDCLLTTHAPFVPSDMNRDKVFIFEKVDREVKVENPNIETFGTTFDTILEECFKVHPPISGVSRKEIEELMQSENTSEISEGIAHLGQSVEKVFLADRLQQLTQEQQSKPKPTKKA